MTPADTPRGAARSPLTRGDRESVVSGRVTGPQTDDPREGVPW
ncbi:hypothetical protein SAMN05660991_01455 [Trujillonella endophytica]|uniref:Uncharacterized protein n=1 Tax=Trujillonella endophytica TaxID=673521 RepID=A0A1H8S0C3_9ACTN|nr:hypothetical protein SAMN05660991_01455 [Trujillella endophytica]